jgi:hypothetical protein
VIATPRRQSYRGSRQGAKRVFEKLTLPLAKQGSSARLREHDDGVFKTKISACDLAH